jgi:hypothetical protein
MVHVVEVRAVDADGNVVTVRQTRPRRPKGSHGAGGASFLGLAKLVAVETAETLNRLEKGVYKGVHSGTVYRSDDPRAP